MILNDTVDEQTSYHQLILGSILVSINSGRAPIRTGCLVHQSLGTRQTEEHCRLPQLWVWRAQQSVGFVVWKAGNVCLKMFYLK